MANVLAVTGISGVGKTTFLTTLRSRCSFQHLQASALIQGQREQSLAATNIGTIAQNQDKRITAFNYRTQQVPPPLIAPQPTSRPPPPQPR